MSENQRDGQLEELISEKCICSFCGKGHKEVPMLIAGPSGVFICDACVGICSNIVLKHDLDRSEQKEELKVRKGRSESKG